MPKYHHVSLTLEQREELLHLIHAGRESARTLSRARILLHADDNQEGGVWFDQDIAESLHVGLATVERTRKRFSQGGLNAALYRKPLPRRAPEKMTGEMEAHLIALTCSSPPDGHARWTLRLLADGMVEAGYVDSLSYETVRRTLKKMSLSRG